METYTLRDGITVLAKRYKGDLCPMTYANLTQAKNAASKIPNAYVMQRGRPFFVRINAPCAT